MKCIIQLKRTDILLEAERRWGKKELENRKRLLQVENKNQISFRFNLMPFFSSYCPSYKGLTPSSLASLNKEKGSI